METLQKVSHRDEETGKILDLNSFAQAIMVDPVYEVNPLTALVDLLTKLILHPLSRWAWFQILERPFFMSK